MAFRQTCKNYTDPTSETSRRKLQHLAKTPGTERIRVFNRDNTIIWSDEYSKLVGTRRTSHLGRLTRALGGQVQAVFNTVRTDVADGGQVAFLPQSIECCVPIFRTEPTLQPR